MNRQSIVPTKLQWQLHVSSASSFDTLAGLLIIVRFSVTVKDIHVAPSTIFCDYQVQVSKYTLWSVWWDRLNAHLSRKLIHKVSLNNTLRPAYLNLYYATIFWFHLLDFLGRWCNIASPTQLDFKNYFDTVLVLQTQCVPNMECLELSAFHTNEFEGTEFWVLLWCCTNPIVLSNLNVTIHIQRVLWRTCILWMLNSR